MSAPWARPDLFPALPAAAGPWGLGRVGQKRRVVLEPAADLEDLRRRVREGGRILFAWTPGDRCLRTVFEVDEIAAEVEARGAEGARRALRRSLPFLVATVALLAAAVVFWPEDREKQLIAVLILLFGILPLWGRGVDGTFEALRRGRRVRRDPARWRALEASRTRFAAWSSRRGSKAALALVAAFVATYVAMVATGFEEAIARFGLVKEGVREGEWWRLLSCAFLHGHPIHLFFNATAALGLARLARSLVSEAHIAGVFFASVVAGSLASTWLLPIPSLGASGGILGWGGLLLGMALFHRDLRATGLVSGLMRWVTLLALIGVAGMRFIDNAAHAGGFLAGLLAGLWIARDPARPLPVRSPVPRAPSLALAAMAAAAWLWMIWLLVR